MIVHGYDRRALQGPRKPMVTIPKSCVASLNPFTPADGCHLRSSRMLSGPPGIEPRFVKQMDAELIMMGLKSKKHPCPIPSTTVWYSSTALVSSTRRNIQSRALTYVRTRRTTHPDSSTYEELCGNVLTYVQLREYVKNREAERDRLRAASYTGPRASLGKSYILPAL